MLKLANQPGESRSGASFELREISRLLCRGSDCACQITQGGCSRHSAFLAIIGFSTPPRLQNRQSWFGPFTWQAEPVRPQQIDSAGLLRVPADNWFIFSRGEAIQDEY